MLYNLCYIGIYIYIFSRHIQYCAKQAIRFTSKTSSLDGKHFRNTISGFSVFFSFFGLLFWVFLSWVFFFLRFGHDAETIYDVCG